MAMVARQQIGPQHQQTDRALGRIDIGRQRQIFHALGHARCHAGMIDTELRILHRRGRLRLPTQGLARTIGIAVDQEADHVEHVFLRAAEPVLQRQEVTADILRGSRDELQHLGNPAQHLHLLFAAGGCLVLAAATQFLEQRQRPRGRLVHIELADLGELDDFACRHGADDGIAMIAPRLECRQNRQEVIFHEEHRRDDNIALGDVLEAMLKTVGITAPFRGGMQRQIETGDLLLQ